MSKTLPIENSVFLGKPVMMQEAFLQITHANKDILTHYKFFFTFFRKAHLKLYYCLLTV